VKRPKPWKTLTVFGWKIPILRLPTIKDNMYGFYDDEAKVIVVDETLKGRELVETMIHEMFHATLDRLYVHAQLDDKFAEVIVEGLTIAIVENFEVKPK